MTFSFFCGMPVLTFDFKAVAEEAIRNARTTHQVIADLMGISASQLSNQFTGRENLSVQRCLYAMRDPVGRRFVIEAALLICKQMGIESPLVSGLAFFARLEWSFEAIGFGKLRMARVAGLPEQRKQVAG